MPKEAKNKEKKVKDNKEKKHFFKDVKAELKKVIWPTTKQLFNNTSAVIVIVLVVGVIVFLLDVCFEKMNSFGVENLKTIVQSSQNEEVNEVIDNTEATDGNNVVENEDVTSNTVEETETNSNQENTENAE